MNKRQAKKAYKKKYGHNPPVKNILYQAYGIDMLRVADAMKIAFQRVEEAVREAAKAIANGWERAKENIRNMSEEEYEEFLESLSPDARGWAVAIRKGAKKNDTGN